MFNYGSWDQYNRFLIYDIKITQCAPCHDGLIEDQNNKLLRTSG